MLASLDRFSRNRQITGRQGEHSVCITWQWRIPIEKAARRRLGKAWWVVLVSDHRLEPRIRLMRRLSILAACGLLSGCMTAATPVSHMSYTQLQEVAKQIEKRCADQGITKQSPQYNACVKQESTREASTRRERYNMIRSGGTVCNQVGTAVICD